MTPKLSEIPLTGWDTNQALKVIWAAIDTIPENTLDDDDSDQLNTAMAWVKDACECDPR